MTGFKRLSEKGVTERLKPYPVVKIAKRTFPALAHKKSGREPEMNELTVLLKGVNCYSGNSVAKPMRSEVSILRRKSTSTGRSAKQLSKFGEGFKENRPVSKETKATGKAKTPPSNKEEQRSVQNFVLKSRSFPAVKHCELNQIDKGSDGQPSAGELNLTAQDDMKPERCAPEIFRAVKMKGKEKSQSLALACSILEGRKIRFKTKSIPKDSMKQSRPSDQNESSGYSKLGCMWHRMQEETQTSHKQQLKQPSACELSDHESWQGVQKNGQGDKPWAPPKDAKKHSKSDSSTDDDDSQGKRVVRPKCYDQQNEEVPQNGTSQAKRKPAKLMEGICKVHCTTSVRGFLCLTSTQPHSSSQGDRRELSKLTSRQKHGKFKTVCAPPGRETLNKSGHKAITDLLLSHTPNKEQNDAANIGDKENQKMMRPSNEAANLNSVLEKRETFQLPKVETYEFSPRSILDSKACSVFSKEKRRKQLRRSTSEDWIHKRKTGLLLSSVFNPGVNKMQRVTIRQPSPVAGVKINVKDPEDILVNTALRAVEKCYIPAMSKEIPPPVKKFVIRLPPVC